MGLGTKGRCAIMLILLTPGWLLVRGALFVSKGGAKQQTVC